MCTCLPDNCSHASRQPTITPALCTDPATHPGHFFRCSTSRPHLHPRSLPRLHSLANPECISMELLSSYTPAFMTSEQFVMWCVCLRGRGRGKADRPTIQPPICSCSSCLCTYTCYVLPFDSSEVIVEVHKVVILLSVQG